MRLHGSHGWWTRDGQLWLRWFRGAGRRARLVPDDERCPSDAQRRNDFAGKCSGGSGACTFNRLLGLASQQSRTISDTIRQRTPQEIVACLSTRKHNSNSAQLALLPPVRQLGPSLDDDNAVDNAALIGFRACF